jgi:hypothetical protein
VKPRLAGLIVMGCALHAFPIAANPIIAETFLVRPTPGNHVQLTYASLRGKPPVPSIQRRFGKCSTPWIRMKGGYRTNLGSGISAPAAIQMCDCDVPSGIPLTYAVTIRAADGEKPFTLQEKTTIIPSTKGAEARKSARPRKSGRLEPWEIPDPPGLQGLDCARACPKAVLNQPTEQRP